MRFGISTVEFLRLYAHLSDQKPNYWFSLKISDGIYWPQLDKSTKEGADEVIKILQWPLNFQIYKVKISFSILKSLAEIWAPFPDAHIFGVHL